MVSKCLTDKCGAFVQMIFCETNPRGAAGSGGPPNLQQLHRAGLKTIGRIRVPCLHASSISESYDAIGLLGHQAV